MFDEGVSDSEIVAAPDRELDVANGDVPPIGDTDTIVMTGGGTELVVDASGIWYVGRLDVAVSPKEQPDTLNKLFSLVAEL